MSVRLVPPLGDRLVITNGAGHFVMNRVLAGVHELELTHIGYGEHRQLVNVPADRTVELRVDLEPKALDVGEIAVRVELRDLRLQVEGFYDRREMGFGYFFDSGTFSRQSLGSALRFVPGMHIRPRNGGSFPYFRRFERPCVPELWVNGIRLRLRDESLEEVVPESDLVGLEIFRPGQTPGEYMRPGTDCGAIVAWLRGP